MTANRTWLGGILVVLGFITFANASTAYLPLNIIVPGSESVTLVPNGGFESPSGFNITPTDWARIGNGDVFAASDIDTDGFRSYVTTADETQIAIGDTNGATSSGFDQGSCSVTPGANYVLSLYMWNFSGFGSPSDPSVGSAPVHGQVLDTTDSTMLADITILHTDPTDGPPGYFAYTSFNTGGNSSLFIKVFFDGYSGPAGVEQLLGGWDNVAVTPLESFAAPELAPEPASAGLLVVSVLALASVRCQR